MEAVRRIVIHYKCGYQFVSFFLFMLNTRQLAHKFMDISSQYWFYTHQNSNVLHKLWQFLHSRAIDEKYRRTISRKKEINVKVWNGGLLIFKPANFKHERIVVVCFTSEQTLLKHFHYNTYNIRNFFKMKEVEFFY